jgi:hypothetical protein
MPGQPLYARHLLGAVLRVGGNALGALALRSPLAGLESPAGLALHEGALRRFFLIPCRAVPLILLTGWALPRGRRAT